MDYLTRPKHWRSRRGGAGYILNKLAGSCVRFLIRRFLPRKFLENSIGSLVFLFASNYRSSLGIHIAMNFTQIQLYLEFLMKPITQILRILFAVDSWTYFLSRIIFQVCGNFVVSYEIRRMKAISSNSTNHNENSSITPTDRQVNYIYSNPHVVKFWTTWHRTYSKH